MKLIDADRVVTVLLFDEETEKIEFKKMSIADYLDLCTDEGCPEETVVLCKDCMFNTSENKCINPDSFFQVPPDDGYCSFGKRRAEDGRENNHWTELGSLARPADLHSV